MQDSNVPAQNAQSAQFARPQVQRDERGRQLLTGARVSQILAACIIPTLGPNKLNVVGRGNPFTRPDGTQVRIFNVAAFATVEDKDKAKKAFFDGYAIEKAGDLRGAQQHYKNAMNHMMSFNITEQNSADYQGIFQINCMVEMGTYYDRKQGSPTFGQPLGQRPVVNNPRPAAVTQSGQSVAADFALPQGDVPPTPQPTANTNFNVRQEARTAPLTQEEIDALNAGPDGNVGADDQIGG